jgi:hypothetical protein
MAKGFNGYSVFNGCVAVDADELVVFEECMIS